MPTHQTLQRVTKAYALYARARGEDMQWMGCRGKRTSWILRATTTGFIYTRMSNLLSYTKHTVSILDSVLMWPVSTVRDKTVQVHTPDISTHCMCHS